jgi:hypothetical protein
MTATLWSVAAGSPDLAARDQDREAVKMKALRNVLILGALTTILMFAWVAVRRNAPPLRLVQAANKVVINAQTLGEYPTTVKRIRVLDMNRSVVWEVAAEGPGAQIRELVLRAGDNQSLADADHGAYRVVEPKYAEFFVLAPGMRYTIELWGNDSAFSRRSASFVLHN